jgi:hypothetical protein
MPCSATSASGQKLIWHECQLLEDSVEKVESRLAPAREQLVDLGFGDAQQNPHPYLYGMSVLAQ